MSNPFEGMAVDIFEEEGYVLIEDPDDLDPNGEPVIVEMTLEEYNEIVGN